MDLGVYPDIPILSNFDAVFSNNQNMVCQTWPPQFSKRSIDISRHLMIGRPQVAKNRCYLKLSWKSCSSTRDFKTFQPWIDVASSFRTEMLLMQQILNVPGIHLSNACFNADLLCHTWADHFLTAHLVLNLKASPRRFQPGETWGLWVESSNCGWKKWFIPS